MKRTVHPLRILFLTYQGDIAGSTNSIAYLTKGLAERGHKIYLGCRKESLLFQMLINSKVELLPMTFTGKLDIKNMRQIRDAVRKYDIQIINAQSSRDRYTSIFAKWFYALNVKVIHTRRQIPESIGGLIQNWFYVKGTDRIVAVSNGVKKALINKKIPANHIEVIYNGTPGEKYKMDNLSDIQLLKEKYNIKEGDIVIGCVSRRKKQEQILQALNHLPYKVKVIFVGINEIMDFEKFLKIPTIHEIHYAGAIPNEETLQYYPLFTIHILASTIEGLSQSLLESMAMGVPVIATNSAGNPDLVQDGVNGLLFDDNDIKTLADNIQKIVSDASLKKQLIVNAKKTAFETFSIEKTIDNYEDFFISLNPGP